MGTVELPALRGEAHEGKVIGLYFSAHWCPPCKTFTPLLVKTYEKLKAEGKEFEVVFVSSDKDKDALSKRYEVEGIPTLVLLDGATGEEIKANGGRANISRSRAAPRTCLGCCGGALVCNAS